jgi:hypothetical protein
MFFQTACCTIRSGAVLPDQEQFAVDPVVRKPAMRQHVPTDQCEDARVSGNDASGFFF